MEVSDFPLIKHIVWTKRFILPVFCFENNRRSNNLEIMPLPHRYIYSVSAFLRIKPETLGLTSRIVVENHIDFSPQQNLRLGCSHMSMNRQNRSHLKSIQHSLRRIFDRIAHITIHPQTLGNLSLGSYRIKKTIIEQHIHFFIRIGSKDHTPNSEEPSVRATPFSKPSY